MSSRDVKATINTYPLQRLIAMRSGPLDAISVGFTSCSTHRGKRKQLRMETSLRSMSKTPKLSCRREVCTHTGCESCGSWTWPCLHGEICGPENTRSRLIHSLSTPPFPKLHSDKTQSHPSRLGPPPLVSSGDQNLCTALTRNKIL